MAVSVILSQHYTTSPAIYFNFSIETLLATFLPLKQQTIFSVIQLLFVVYKLLQRAGHSLIVVKCRLYSVHHRLSIVNVSLHIVNASLPIVNHLLWVVNQSLHRAANSLHTAGSLLYPAHRSLQVETRCIASLR